MRSHLRQKIAHLAAQMLARDGRMSYLHAKRKAAERLHAPREAWPDNQELQQALRAELALFGGQEHSDLLQQQRQTALAAMRFLENYDPCLTGAVLDGSASDGSPISLHLFADTLEEVSQHLDENDIPYEIDERHYPCGTTAPSLAFLANDLPVRLVIFPPRSRHHAPRSPLTGKPMQRADRQAVEKLLAATATR